MPPSTRLEELRAKVRTDPGSRYFLGLAEELLRLGERVEALAVLEAGLEARPGQVAATVAKARCLLELDRPRDALPALESVLRRDPEHLVAAKLAVEVWLRLKDPERARESLARYRPLGAADPELARLEARLRALPEAASEGATDRGLEAGEGAAAGERDRADDGGPATLTLGNLYLAQGHRREAERIFRRLLRNDPDHTAARQALARMGVRLDI